MNVLEMLIIILVLTITILSIEAIIKFKKSEGKLIDEVKKPLIVRMKILRMQLDIQLIYMLVQKKMANIH